MLLRLILFYVFASCFPAIQVYAQNNINWINHAGGNFTDRAQHIVNDQSGSLFVCGQFSDSISIKNEWYVSSGLLDGLMMKADTSGIIQWVTQWKGPKDEQLIRMQWLSATQLIVSGTFSDSLQYDNTIIYSLGFDDAFIASVNPANGNLNWITTAGTLYGYEFIGGLCVANHRIFWSVNYSGAVLIGNNMFGCVGAYDFLLSELDTLGNILQSKPYHGSGVDLVSAIAANPEGTLFACGKFNGQLSDSQDTLNSNGMFDIFYLSQEDDGSLNWLRSAGGYATEVANALAVGQEQDVYMGCWMQDTLMFQDSLMIPDPSGELFVVKLDYEGNKEWLFRGFPDSGSDQITDITITCKGAVLFTGLTTYFADVTPESATDDSDERTERCAFGDTYIAKLATDGTLLWLKNTLGTNSNLGLGLSADPYGHIYVSGYFTDSLYAGIFDIPGNGGNDMMFFMLEDDEWCYSSPVSVAESPTEEAYLYPNPSNTNASIVLKHGVPCTITVSDLFGRIICSQTTTSITNRIPIGDCIKETINEGLYLVTIQHPYGSATLRWSYLK